MRLLTTDELSAVSGGSINGQNDPYSYNGKKDTTDWCSKIDSKSVRDQCYKEKARSQACPGGWTETTEPGSAGRDGIKGRSSTVECDTGNSGGDGDSGGDSGDNGNDKGKD